MCRWWNQCDQRRRKDDHLSLVPGVSHFQRRELQGAGVNTVAELGTLPLPFKPRRSAIETYERGREQARVQLAGRASGSPVHELLPIIPGHGLTRLPMPTVGDIFLDIEGDPFVQGGGREYLFWLVIVGSEPECQHWNISSGVVRQFPRTAVSSYGRLGGCPPASAPTHLKCFMSDALRLTVG